jgi:hypothetical protein
MPLRDTRPQDTLENLIASGRNPLEWGSCAKNVKDEVLGCGRYPTCPWRDKPKNGGVQILKVLGDGTGSERTTIMSCYDYLWQKPQYESNGCIVNWVKEEGETIQVRGSRPLPLKPGQVVAIHEDFYDEVVVPPYPRLSEKHLMAKRITELRKQREAEKREQRHDQILGIKSEPEFSPPEVLDLAALKVEPDVKPAKPAKP